MGEREQVVLLDESGRATGAALKADVHSDQTPLHLAFSCYLVNDQGQLLLTRRALTKQTWPGVWTNSFCGHPMPGERFADALERRARDELGAHIAEVESRLPDFRYRAVDASGVVEYEVCPVFTARLVGDLSPEPTEVAEWVWVAPERVLEAIAVTPFVFSPWLSAQLPLLHEAGVLRTRSTVGRRIV